MRLVWENETIKAKRHNIAALMQSVTRIDGHCGTLERMTRLLYANARRTDSRRRKGARAIQYPRRCYLYWRSIHGGMSLR